MLQTANELAGWIWLDAAGWQAAISISKMAAWKAGRQAAIWISFLKWRSLMLMHKIKLIVLPKQGKLHLQLVNITH